MRGTKLNIDSYFSRVIHIHNFPTILLAGSLDRKKKNMRAGRTKKKIKSQNCSSSVMPPDQHNDASQDNIKL
jgi:hypothetical protein